MLTGAALIHIVIIVTIGYLAVAPPLGPEAALQPTQYSVCSRVPSGGGGCFLVRCFAEWFLKQHFCVCGQFRKRAILVVPALIDDIVNKWIAIELRKFHILEQVHNLRSMLVRIVGKTLIVINLKAIVD